jgi:hypothetical protein
MEKIIYVKVFNGEIYFREVVIPSEPVVSLVDKSDAEMCEVIKKMTERYCNLGYHPVIATGLTGIALGYPNEIRASLQSDKRIDYLLDKINEGKGSLIFEKYYDKDTVGGFMSPEDLNHSSKMFTFTLLKDIRYKTFE